MFGIALATLGQRDDDAWRRFSVIASGVEGKPGAAGTSSRTPCPWPAVVSGSKTSGLQGIAPIEPYSHHRARSAAALRRGERRCRSAAWPRAACGRAATDLVFGRVLDSGPRQALSRRVARTGPAIPNGVSADLRDRMKPPGRLRLSVPLCVTKPALGFCLLKACAGAHGWRRRQCWIGRTGGSAPVQQQSFARHCGSPDYALIAPHLSAVEQSVNDVIYNPGDDVEVVHFPCGPAMMSVRDQRRGRAGGRETVLVGREGAGGRRHRQPLAAAGLQPHHGQVRRPVRPASRWATSRRPRQEVADCAAPSSPATPTACWRRSSRRPPATPSIRSSSAPPNGCCAATRRTGDNVVPFTHEELAGMLGAGRSHTTRVLKEFRSRGMIETRRGSVCGCATTRRSRRSPAAATSWSSSHFDEVLAGVYPNGGS